LLRGRDRCDEAGLPHCSAHGLRKAGATIAAENGATAPQLTAIFDWETLAVAQKYIDEANRKKKAAQAMPLIVPPPRDGGSPEAQNAS
jgi:integrase